MHSLADENPNMPSMSESTSTLFYLECCVSEFRTVTEPNKTTAVFFRVREDDCPALLLPECVLLIRLNLVLTMFIAARPSRSQKGLYIWLNTNY